MKKVEAKKEIIVDAKGRTLGRVASEVATLLMGKNSALYKREAYSGFPVRVQNAGKTKITPNKLEQIYHTRYSGHPGGLRVIKAKETVATKGFPELLKLSVYHMLPGNKLRREMMKNLKIEE